MAVIRNPLDSQSQLGQLPWARSRNGRFAPRHRSFLIQRVAAATLRRSNAGLAQVTQMRKRKLTVRAPVSPSVPQILY